MATQLYREYLGGGGKAQQKIFGSSLEDIKQKAIKAGINPVNLQEAQQFTNGAWSPFLQGQTATYKGSEGIAEQSFVGTNQEITQQATAAGINPSNLFSGLDKFIPEATDNINVDEGTESLLKGGQSDWFKTFQDAYVTGQNTIQQSIADLMKQQADLTEETRQGYQEDIDKATTGLETATAKPYGEELGEELSEKYKLQEKIDKLGEIGNQMAQLQGAYDASIAETEMSGITIGQSRGELSRKQREYASKATVLQAQAAVVTDQYNLVKDIVEKYYLSAESERTAEISRYQNLLDVATQAKLALTADDKTQITNQINILLGEQAKQEANKDKIMALAIDPATAEAFFNSDASFDDSYETILDKMSPYMSKYAKEKRLDSLSEVGTGATSGGGFLDIMQMSIDAGATPEQAAREAANASELAGIPVNQKTLENWLKVARKLIKTPVPEAPIPIPEPPKGTPTERATQTGETLKEALPYLPEVISEMGQAPKNWADKYIYDPIGGFFSGLFGG